MEMENTKKTLSKKKKITIAVVIAALACAGVAAGFILYNPLKLKKDTVNVEFGQQISTEASDYLKTDVKKEVVKNTKVTYEANPVKDKKYDQIGEYTVTLKYKNKTAVVTVKVQDTTKPEFNATAEAGIETIEGVELKWKDLIKATDLSDVKVTFDDKKVKLDKAGEYTLIATAKDEAGNKVTKKIKVTVKEKPANMSGSDVSVDSKTGKVTMKANTYNSYSGGGSSSSDGGSSSSASNEMEYENKYSGEIGDGGTWESGDWVDLPEGW